MPRNAFAGYVHIRWGTVMNVIREVDRHVFFELPKCTLAPAAGASAAKACSAGPVDKVRARKLDKLTVHFLLMPRHTRNSTRFPFRSRYFRHTGAP